VLGRWEEARCRAQHAIACVWSFETHWQNPQERMYTAVASYHNLALAQRALGMHALASISISLSLSASINFFGREGSLSKRVCSLLAACPSSRSANFSLSNSSHFHLSRRSFCCAVSFRVFSQSEKR
jgi:hypothetical protein